MSQKANADICSRSAFRQCEVSASECNFKMSIGLINENFSSFTRI